MATGMGLADTPSAAAWVFANTGPVAPAIPAAMAPAPSIQSRRVHPLSSFSDRKGASSPPLRSRLGFCEYGAGSAGNPRRHGSGAEHPVASCPSSLVVLGHVVHQRDLNTQGYQGVV